ncbi:MAG: carbon-nitrogen hydrolase family protein [Acidobacteria bacterium]|nr:carbon-nitrogen hydrolase family protein [Acidobacteriota bacterium]
MSTAPTSRQLETCTVAAVNFRGVPGDKEATLDKLLANTREAGEQGADLVVFPEESIPGPPNCTCAEVGGPCPAHLATSETIPGPTTDAVELVARQYDLYVCFGMIEKDQDDPTRLYKSAAVIGPDGVLGSYHKVHLGTLPWATEGITCTPGTTLPVFETRFGTIGVQICYDFWFNPELTRLLALKGAQIIVNCAGSYVAPGRPDTMTAVAVARAAENLVYTVVSNSTGGVGNPDVYAGSELTTSRRAGVFAGHSLITGPAFPRFGEVLAQAGELEEIIFATLSADRLARWDPVFPWTQWRKGRLSSASRLIADEFAALANSTDQS